MSQENKNLDDIFSNNLFREFSSIRMFPEDDKKKKKMLLAAS